MRDLLNLATYASIFSSHQLLSQPGGVTAELCAPIIDRVQERSVLETLQRDLSARNWHSVQNMLADRDAPVYQLPYQWIAWAVLVAADKVPQGLAPPTAFPGERSLLDAILAVERLGGDLPAGFYACAADVAVHVGDPALERRWLERAAVAARSDGVNSFPLQRRLLQASSAAGDADAGDRFLAIARGTPDFIPVLVVDQPRRTLDLLGSLVATLEADTPGGGAWLERRGGRSHPPLPIGLRSGPLVRVATASAWMDEAWERYRRGAKVALEDPVGVAERLIAEDPRSPAVAIAGALIAAWRVELQVGGTTETVNRAASSVARMLGPLGPRWPSGSAVCAQIKRAHGANTPFLDVVVAALDEARGPTGANRGRGAWSHTIAVSAIAAFIMASTEQAAEAWPCAKVRWFPPSTQPMTLNIVEFDFHACPDREGSSSSTGLVAPAVGEVTGPVDAERDQFLQAIDQLQSAAGGPIDADSLLTSWLLRRSLPGATWSRGPGGVDGELASQLERLRDDDAAGAPAAKIRSDPWRVSRSALAYQGIREYRDLLMARALIREGSAEDLAEARDWLGAIAPSGVLGGAADECMRWVSALERGSPERPELGWRALVAAGLVSPPDISTPDGLKKVSENSALALLAALHELERHPDAPRLGWARELRNSTPPAVPLFAAQPHGDVPGLSGFPASAVSAVQAFSLRGTDLPAYASDEARAARDHLAALLTAPSDEEIEESRTLVRRWFLDNAIPMLDIGDGPFSAVPGEDLLAREFVALDEAGARADRFPALPANASDRLAALWRVTTARAQLRYHVESPQGLLLAHEALAGLRPPDAAAATCKRRGLAVIDALLSSGLPDDPRLVPLREEILRGPPDDPAWGVLAGPASGVGRVASPMIADAASLHSSSLVLLAAALDFGVAPETGKGPPPIRLDMVQQYLRDHPLGR